MFLAPLRRIRWARPRQHRGKDRTGGEAAPLLSPLLAGGAFKGSSAVRGGSQQPEGTLYTVERDKEEQKKKFLLHIEV